MKRITFARLAVLMLAVAGLVLQGCGGDDAYSISAEDQARIDALMAELEEAEEDLEAAAERAEEAEGQVEYLTAEIGMMGDTADPDGSLYAQLNDKMAALMAAQAEVTRLTGVIGMDPSDDDPNGSGLRGDLAMAQADLAVSQMEVGRLTGVIGMDPSDDDPNGSGLMGDLAMVRADLMAANDRVAELEGEIGRMPGGDDGGSGLRKQLADAEADRDMYMARANELAETLGMMDDPTTEANEATGLRADLMAAQADRDMYMDMVGMMDDPDTDANEATGLRADLMAAEADRDMYQAQIGSMDDPASTEEGASLYAQINAKDAEIADLKEKLADAEEDLADLRATRSTEANIARGLSIVDAIEDVTFTNGQPMNDKGGVNGVPFDSPAAACADATCTNHDIAVVNGDITLSGFDGDTSTVDGWLNARMEDSSEMVDIYADDIRGTNTDLFYFGWWLDDPVDNPPDEPDASPGVISGNRRTAVFVGGTNPLDALGADGEDITDYDFNDIQGTATYEGVAAGQYAVETRTAGVRDDMDSGSFTADAELTANFGDDAAGLMSITGTIDDFELSGSYDPGDLWVIQLRDGAPNRDLTGTATTGAYVPYTGAADARVVTTGGLVETTNNTVVGISGIARMTIGNVRGGDGTWQAEFYRERVSTLQATPVLELAPGSIGGSFGIRDDNVTVIGAFGAHTDD